MNLSFDVHRLTPAMRRALVEGTTSHPQTFGEPLTRLEPGTVPRGSSARSFFLDMLRSAEQKANGPLAARVGTEGFMESFHPCYVSAEEAAGALAVDSGHPGVWFFVDSKKPGQRIEGVRSVRWREAAFAEARRALQGLPSIFLQLADGQCGKDRPRVDSEPVDDIVRDFRLAASAVLEARDDLCHAPTESGPRIAPEHAYAVENLASLRMLDEKSSRSLVLLLSLLSTHDGLAPNRAVHAALDYSLFHRVDVRAPDPWDIGDLGIGPREALPALVEALVEGSSAKIPA